MSLRLTVSDLHELPRYPKVLKPIVAGEGMNTPVELDLGKLAYNNPIAAVEAILLARTLGVTLVLIRANSPKLPQ